MLVLGLYEGSIGAAGAGTCVHSEVGFILIDSDFQEKYVRKATDRRSYVMNREVSVSRVKGNFETNYICKLKRFSRCHGGYLIGLKFISDLLVSLIAGSNLTGNGENHESHRTETLCSVEQYLI
jgi:hypothetical protein